MFGITRCREKTCTTFENCTFISFSIAGFLNYVQKLEIRPLYYRCIQLVPLDDKTKYIYKQLQDQDI